MSHGSVVTDKPILVTGAGGWLASHVVYQLLEAGYKVRGTVRSVSSPSYDFLRAIHPRAATHLELVQADLLRDAGWDDACEGVEYVLHVASPFHVTYSDEQKELIQPAVQGVEHVFEAAFRSGSVKRIVQTSSVCAIVYGHPQQRYESKKLFTEEEWSIAENIVGYEKSKTLAEKRAWEMIDQHNNETASIHKVELVVMNPGFIFGPVFDKKHQEGESSEQVKRILLKTYPLVPALDSSHVDVRDVATAHIKAMEAPSEKVAGQRFLLKADDGDLSFRDEALLMSKMFKPYGFNPSTTIAPDVFLHIGKYFLKNARAAADKLHKSTYVSNEKATKVLGMTWRPVKDAFWGHGLTLMRHNVIQQRKTPQEIVDAYRAY